MITVAKCNNNISVQDLGRAAAQHCGFSASGAADEYSFLLANQLLGNAANTPAFEVFMGNVTLNVSQPCDIAITGAPCEILINHQLAPSRQRFSLNAGDTLQLKTPKNMLYSYISIKGGINCKKWLESASFTSHESHIDGHIQPIVAGDRFAFSESSTIKNTKGKPLNKERSLFFHQPGEQTLTLRFIPSNFFNAWTPHHQSTFLDQRYCIATNSNKMGYRLTGKAITVETDEQRLSKPVSLGTIQLPPDGQPIVLMKARQTIGGYPVLGTVIQTDVYRLSQKRPSEHVCFKTTSLAQAQAQLLAYKHRMGLSSP
ncbi:biotin-dependent carboxyltransferase family protein [Thalassotalea sediminis]|uniref:5-oxoprolinase subunit C family protein n=1 Tax=Thalassotalea sediminis TaxID=1759089 RepID=UPI002572BF54|nr:biotin-dependent carboxyltransferase family protein [Thalassotalea sediminis]